MWWTDLVILFARLGAGAHGIAFVVSFLVLWSSPFDHRLRRPVQEDEFGKQVLLQGELQGLPHQVDVQTKLQHSVHVRQILEHDLGARAGEDAGSKHSREHQDQRGVDTDDAESCEEKL